MIIKSLELSNFRNYNSLNMEFDSGTNILYGDNAQGKTNLLESIKNNIIIVKPIPKRNTTKSSLVKKPNINCDFLELAGIK